MEMLKHKENKQGACNYAGTAAQQLSSVLVRPCLTLVQLFRWTSRYTAMFRYSIGWCATCREINPCRSVSAKTCPNWNPTMLFLFLSLQVWKVTFLGYIPLKIKYSVVFWHSDLFRNKKTIDVSVYCKYYFNCKIHFLLDFKCKNCTETCIILLSKLLNI